ncbi:Hydrophobin [Penicillium capsulatum]|uniref:Hydrophobin n=1 Tax=Penicillium capsulatum TaxID=69766 RepID=A0A9W9LZW1_9EURO|nr:Hydrophobin [Penicillium capsulatum]KAJ6129495.1 Hydrophobin [Penicillium capsulatum]
MRFSIISVLALTGMVAAAPHEGSVMKRDDPHTTVEKAATAVGGKKTDNKAPANCIRPILCCGSLTTPLDPLVDPVLLLAGVNASAIVGSVGLLCEAYNPDTCTSEPQCCTEANLLGGELAIGCGDLKE